MFKKVLLFAYIVEFSRAVLVDTNDGTKKESAPLSSQGWQTIKVYHPPSQTYSYKYEPYAYPKYEFEYAVSDKHTGDHKHHKESRDGDQVRGEYSLVESDGSLRKVQYHADDHSGFNAIVSKTVNKHGDHAVSIADHTTFFYPVGHNLKINHYFPGKNYHYQEVERPEQDKLSKPVHEQSSSNHEGAEVAAVESGEKLVQPVQFEEHANESTSKENGFTPKVDVLEVIPSIVALAPQRNDIPKINAELANPELIAENADILPSNELQSPKNDQKYEKGDQNDSEVASSYYHSKIYYIY